VTVRKRIPHRKLAAEISLTQYTLELADKTRKTIQVERRYKKMKYRGEERISFWVKVV
jgi:hypothetical protein